MIRVKPRILGSVSVLCLKFKCFDSEVVLCRGANRATSSRSNPSDQNHRARPVSPV